MVALLPIFQIHAQVIDKVRIDSVFSDWQKEHQPGGVVAVMKGDDIVYKNAFGLADIGRKVPNDFNLKYDLASLAKQFTGAAIMLLAENGNLSVDDGLKKYYPQFRMADSVKIKNLLDHTSGIREAYVLATLAGKVNLKGELRKKFNEKEYLLKVLSRETDLNFRPGTELAYTNVNYILLADIVEKVSGKPFHEFVDSALFRRAGMNNTVFRYQDHLVVDKEAKGYLARKKSFKVRKDYGGALGDGKLMTTIDDLILWERFLRHQPTLSSKLYTSSRFNNGNLTHYGCGFWIDEYRGLPQINHGGDDGRFTSFIIKFPEQEIAIMIMANSSRYNNTVGKAYAIANLVLASRFLKPRYTKKRYVFVKPTTSELNRHAGMYFRIDEHGLAAIRKVSVVRDTLHVSSWYYDQGIAVNKVTANQWAGYTKAGANLSYQFRDSVTASFEEQFEDRETKRFNKVTQQLAARNELTGKFVNPSTGVTITIKMKGSGIQARKGIIKIPLISLGGDQFYAIQHDALFVFRRGDNVSLKINAADFRNFNLIKQ